MELTTELKTLITEVDARAKVLDPVWKQINTDILDYDGAEFTLKGFHGNTKDTAIPGVANVTSRICAIFVDSMIQVLTTEKPRLKVTWRGEGNHDQAIALLELWWRTTEQLAEERHEGIGHVDLYGTAVFNCMFSWVMVRDLLVAKDDKDGLEPDSEFLDPQTVVWDEYYRENGRRYLGYVAIDSLISKAKAKQMYGAAISDTSMQTPSTSNWNCRDLWYYKDGKVTESIIIGGKLVKENDWSVHGIAELPFSLKPVMSKPLVTGRTIDKMGECIFGNARSAYKEYNTWLTLQKTEALQALVPPIAIYSRNGAKDILNNDYPSFGAMPQLSIDNQEKIELINPSRSQTSVVASSAFGQQVDTERQMATIDNVSFGSAADTMTIGVFDRKSRATSMILNARKKVLEETYKRRFILRYKQFIAMAGPNIYITAEKASGGTMQIKNTDLASFKDMFNVVFEVTAQEPMGDAMKIQMQKSKLDAGLPREYADKDWDVDNPQALADARIREAALAQDPVLYMFEYMAQKQAELDLATDENTKKRLKMELMYIEGKLEDIAKQIAAGGQNG